MEQVENSLTLKDLLETLLRWQASQYDDDDLRLSVRHCLREHLPESQVTMLENGSLPESELLRIVHNLADVLTRSSSEGIGTPSDRQPNDSFLPAKASRLSANTVRQEPVLEVELLPEPEHVPEEPTPRFRWDPISLYESVDGVVRFLTWDYLSFQGLMVVACLVAVGSLPFVLENPEFSKDPNFVSPLGVGAKVKRQQPLSDAGPSNDSLADSEEKARRDAARRERRGNFGLDLRDNELAANRGSDDDATAAEREENSASASSRSGGASFSEAAASSQKAGGTGELAEDQSTNSKAEDDPVADIADSGNRESMKSDGSKTEQVEEIDLDSLLAPIFSSAAEQEENQSNSGGDQNNEDTPEQSGSSEAGNKSASSPRSEQPAKQDSQAAKDQAAKAQVTKDQVTKDQVTKDQVTKDQVTKDQVTKETERQAVMLLEQGKNDEALALLEAVSRDGSVESNCHLLQVEALLRKGDTASRLAAWGMLAKSDPECLLGNLLCVRLLLTTQASEREAFLDLPTSSIQPRYRAWAVSWLAATNPQASNWLQQCIKRYSESSYLDRIFVANAEYAISDVDAAYRRLLDVQTELQALPMPQEASVENWLLANSVREVSDRIRRSLQGLSVRLTSTPP